MTPLEFAGEATRAVESAAYPMAVVRAKLEYVSARPSPEELDWLQAAMVELCDMLERAVPVCREIGPMMGAISDRMFIDGVLQRRALHPNDKAAWDAAIAFRGFRRSWDRLATAIADAQKRAEAPVL